MLAFLQGQVLPGHKHCLEFSMLQVIYTNSPMKCTLENGFVELSVEQHVWISKIVICNLNGILFDCKEQEKQEICTWCWPYPLVCHIYISICAKVGVTRGGKVGACCFWYSLQSGHIRPGWEAWYCISLALSLWFHVSQPVTWCQSLVLDLSYQYEY